MVLSWAVLGLSPNILISLHGRGATLNQAPLRPSDPLDSIEFEGFSEDVNGRCMPAVIVENSHPCEKMQTLLLMEHSVFLTDE